MNLLALPSSIFFRICSILDAEDIPALTASCKRLQDQTDGADLDVWRPKTLEIYSTRLSLESILTDHLNIPISKKSLFCSETVPEKSWKQRYIEHREAFKRSYELWNRDEERVGDETMDQVNREFQELKEELQKIREKEDEGLKGLTRVVERCLEILDQLPTHPGCFHLLAFTAYILNRLDDAQTIIEMGMALDSSYEPLQELEKEVVRLLKGIQGEEGEEPLLENETTLSTPLMEALRDLFGQYDKDSDSLLSYPELGAFILKSNGIHPPLPFLRNMCQEFNTESTSRGLTFDGFCRFFLLQTLSDPAETRQDLVKHGFDGRTLVKTQVARPA